ncbi:MAG: hypothetical protein PUB21_08225 [Bacteroidales bacterium]|nr:hypothetical protein [Bacteroidales bacterium]
MRKLMFFAIAAMLMTACTKDEELPSAGGNENGALTFEISTVNKLSDGMTGRSSIYSQEATQHVTNVNVYVFKNNAGNYTYVKTYNIPGWSDPTTFKRYAVADADTVPAGDYKFLAVGRDASDLFTVTTPDSNTKFEDMIASVSASGNESEIFAGSAQATIAKGSRVSIEMTRKVAAILGYFKNVPQTLDNKTVKFLRLTISNSNQKVNLTTGMEVTGTPASYNIINMDLSTQAVDPSRGVYVGNDLSGQNVVKVTNSQLSGSFIIPVSNATMTLGLYDASNNAIRTWIVKDSQGGTSTFNILANNFYSIGKKVQAGNTNGGTADPGDDDDPVDLLTDQNIILTINPNWTAIHDLIIQ